MEAAYELATILKARGKDVTVHDICRDDMSECLGDAFKYSEAVFAACTYDGGLFTPMVDFLHRLHIKGYSSRRVGLIENGSWAPTAGRIMKEKLSEMKGVEVLEPVVTIKSRLKDSSILNGLADVL